MEIKSIVERLAWLIVDGLAAVWLVKTLFQMALGGSLMQPFVQMAEALCG